jgi:hypothetical protein
MTKILKSIGKALLLYLPMLFCLYIPILYAINFLFISPRNSLALLMALIMLLISFILFIILVYLWRLLLKTIYSKLVERFAINGLKQVVISWAIASTALCIAFLFESKLWNSPELLLSENSKYFTRTATEAIGKISAIWLLICSLFYGLRR